MFMSIPVPPNPNSFTISLAFFKLSRSSVFSTEPKTYNPSPVSSIQLVINTSKDMTSSPIVMKPDAIASFTTLIKFSGANNSANSSSKDAASSSKFSFAFSCSFSRTMSLIAACCSAYSCFNCSNLARPAAEVSRS